ncbi:hypothetical protein cypCar_00029768 [Cyprinus carpio]|nr:hypothetical protein cypCar_00029768 [Cyprinus carpio]
MHQHQHTHQHTFTPFPASLPPAAIIGPPTAPPMFDKYAPKLDNPFLRHSNFFPSYPPTMPGMPPLLPHSGPFSSLQGAFQPKAPNPIDVAGRPGTVPHTLLQKDPRITDPFRTSVRKPGKWCAVHVQIAWQIYHHQQKMKKSRLEWSGTIPVWQFMADHSVAPNLWGISNLSWIRQPSPRDSLDRNRHSNRSSPASAPVSYQISSLIRSNSQNSTDSGRHRSGSADRNREPEKELLDRQREAGILGDIKVKESRSPGKEITDRRSSDDSLKSVHRSPSPYSKNVLNDAGTKMGVPQPLPIKESERDRKETSSGDLLQKVKNDMKIKEEHKEEQDVMVIGSEAAPKPQVPPPPHQTTPIAHHPALSHQPPPPSPRCSDPPTPSSLHGVPMPHSLPLTLSAMHQMGSLNALERTRMAPFMGVSPHAAGRDRLPHPAFSWDPLREAYRNFDLQRRMDFHLRSEPGHRFPGVYDPERVYRDREPHDYSHHEHLLEVRREQERLRQQAEERERLHLREELDRARLHQLHQSPIEGHLPHISPFMSHLGGMPYPRLSPSTGHNGLLNRTPPTAALSAPPPLVPSGAARPASPRRTTPITTQDPREYSPSRNPKEVEAR